MPAGDARGECQVASAVLRGQARDGVGGRRAAFEIACDFFAQLRRHGAPQQLVSLFVQHIQLHAAAGGGQFAQAGDAAVLEGGGRGVQHDDGGRAEVQRRLSVALAGLVAQPDGASDADRGRHLREQDRQEELPEQPAHRYSRISW
jgi:hypothetical protein